MVLTLLSGPLATEVAHKMKLRPYQADVKSGIYEAWGPPGVRNVLAILPTGAGKTVTFSDILHEHRGPSVAIAHRQELVGQISLALAREGVRHKIIAPKSVIKFCIAQHVEKVGRSYYDPNAKTAVAGVDTLIRRGDPAFKAWANSVTLWVMDEAHHVLTANKWGAAVEMFPNAKGLGVTATPCRADGKGLGRHADGVFDVMVEGPMMRALINMGYLTDYRIVAPKTTDLNLDAVPIGSGGEYQKKALRRAVKRSRLVGDVVKEYQKFAMGKRGVTFATDLDTAQEICDQFNLAGVPAKMVHGGSTDAERGAAVTALESGEILNLVNVDLFGEGFDLPAIEVVSMARPTKSYSLYVQQFGRALRLMIANELKPLWDTFTNAERLAHIAASSKPSALIIDHVGNHDLLAGGHGLPDSVREWSLDRRDRNGGSGGVADDIIPTRVCPAPTCQQVYERLHLACPYCNHIPIRTARSGPEHVDGDLTEISPEVLARMRGEVAEAEKDVKDYALQIAKAGTPQKYRWGMVEKFKNKQEKAAPLRDALRECMAWYGGVLKDRQGLNDRQIMRKFYYTFGVDVLTAQALDGPDSLVLAERITIKIGKEYNADETSAST